MNDDHLLAHVKNPARLAALHDVALLDTPTEEAFDRLSRLAAQFVNAPVALVSLVDADRQFFKSCVGLPEPWYSRRETPLSHSFCQHNRFAGQPMIIEDARMHPIFKDHPALHELNVIAYLGIPLTTSDNYVLGSLCVIDVKPRQWNEVDIAVIKDLAAAMMTEIQLRAEAVARHRAEGQRDSFAKLNTRLRQEMYARKRAENRQRQLAAQLHQGQKMEALGSLAGGIAHEFNNVLAMILGSAELARYEVSEVSAASQRLQDILAAGQRAKEIVQQLLAFSHPDGSNQEPVQLAPLVREALLLLRAMLPATIEIRTDLPDDSGEVYINRTQLHQVIINLCANAEYAMRKTGGTLEISVEAMEADDALAASHRGLRPGPYLCLQIRDTGPGMPFEVQERIFEPFFTTKGIGEGTGMGLAIVHGIVASHGGAITVESTLGEGTTFSIYLPQIAQTLVQAADLPADESPQGAGCVLFLDDEEVLVLLGKALLELLGYEVVAHTNSLEALTDFQAAPDRFDVVITDQTMPHMTGMALAQELRRIRPDIPIILCTGFSHQIDSDKARMMEIDAFCMKPLMQHDLAVTIQQVLDKRAPHAT